ncbi:MAG: VanZ family protein [Desulfobulbaceae bacterium]|nr:VanZ family protein [Desulfobulbaceae bacterium]
MIKPQAFFRNYWIALTLIIFAAITALSLWPPDNLPSVPGSDKTHHFIAYAALIFPTVLRKPRYWPLIGLFFISWSGVIELLQPYANRSGEWLDMAANTAGLVCGLLAAQITNRLFPVD